MASSEALKKSKALYEGKSKTLYACEDPEVLLCEFRDDATAFDGVKKATLSRKGMVNNAFNAHIMSHLEKAGIPTHLIALENETCARVKHLKMLPIECIIRNVAAGSVCRRLGATPGTVFAEPIFEFCLKDDALHDPIINETHILAFGWASASDISRMKALTFEVNTQLRKLFDAADLILVDYKLEFGHQHGTLYLGDEFSPDGCRIWDKETQKVLDKDRFRHDMGDVIEAYEEVAYRMGIKMPEFVV